MPDHRLKRLGVRRDVLRVCDRYQHTDVRDLGREAAVAADDAGDAGSDLVRVTQRTHEVRTDVLFEAAAAHREHEDEVVQAQAAGAQPGREDAVPAFVVGARRDFGDVICGGVGFEAGELAEVVDRVRRVGRAAADAEDEQAPARVPRLREPIDEPLDRRAVEPGDDAFTLSQISLDESHHSVPLRLSRRQVLAQERQPVG